jgi:hypothetical protein
MDLVSINVEILFTLFVLLAISFDLSIQMSIVNDPSSYSHRCILFIGLFLKRKIPDWMIYGTWKQLGRILNHYYPMSIGKISNCNV